ncbi:MAG: hypothetical protein JNL41_09650 [Phenylobacterium sp.]|uniref:phosphopantetheine-binding protein n=1 Tax=Phenylobacterium sp. TaxID=1871053 RepID=UPI001A3AFD34|nr:phosphopantetheine-binding protein [Phenylobacterium sp.]MBL8554530.1 hypothetical protein [Phenylobacterium sp.]
MSAVTADDVRAVLAEFLNATHGDGAYSPADLADDCDLLLSGMIDSLGMLSLVETLQQRFGEELDFEELDPEDMTVVGPLASFVVERVAG